MTRSKLPGTELKNRLLRITRTAKFISSEVYDPSNDAFRQMKSLVEQINRAAAFMETLKPKEEDSTEQMSMLDAVSVNGTEEHHATV